MQMKTQNTKIKVERIGHIKGLGSHKALAQFFKQIKVHKKRIHAEHMFEKLLSKFVTSFPSLMIFLSEDTSYT